MDDTPDPATQFFPDVDPEDIDLYAALNLTKTATLADIKQSYRKQALLYHPDKHVNKSAEAQAEAHTRFQQIGFAYAVLSDETRRARYDKTGRTDEGGGLEPGEGGWEAYFEDLFDSVTRGKLDEMKKEYQGSEEELNDLKEAYVKVEGSVEGIMAEIPHSTFEDEDRFVGILKPLIKKGDLPKFPTWEADLKDKKGKTARKQRAEKEAKEAEDHAKELGVWDEFYGSGKEGPRKGKGKAKNATANDEDGDVSALQALILKKQQKRESILDSLLAKYGGEEENNSRKRGGKRKGKDEDEEEAEEVETAPRKKAKATSSAKGAGRKKGQRAR